jgi:hypothetical protein
MFEALGFEGGFKGGVETVEKLAGFSFLRI